MAIITVSRPTYQITTPGFEELLFTASSKDSLVLPDAVRYAAEEGSSLQSAREAIGFRLAANGADDANRYQTTRTAALYFNDHGKSYVAFDDDTDLARNILLARASDGYESHRSTGRWRVPKADPVIGAALGRAANANRILQTPLENAVRLSTTGDGASSYGQNPFIRATIGDDLAPAYAGFLHEQGFCNGYEWLLTTRNLHELGLDNDHVEVRRVGVGGAGGSSGMDSLDAGDRCVDAGRARGVRAKNSTGNKG